MKAFTFIKNMDSIDREATPFHSFIRVAGPGIGNWYPYLISGTGPQLTALNALSNVEGIVAVTENGDVKWVELDEQVASAVRARLNTWLDSRGLPNIPADWTYRRLVREVYQQFNSHFDLDSFDVMDV